MKRYLFVGALVLLTLFASFADDQKSSQQVVVRVRSGWNEASLPNWPAAIKKYEADHPNVKIVMEYTPATGGSGPKLMAEFVAGNPPDVAQAFKTFFNDFASRNLLEKLNAEYDRYGWKDGVLMGGSRAWSSKLLDAANPKADVYGASDYVVTSVFFYNTKIFAKLGLKEPTTVDELIDVAHKLSAAGYKPLVGAGNKANFVDLLAKVQVQFTGLQYLLDLNKGAAKLTDAPMLKAMQVVERLMKAGVVDKSCLTYTEPDAVAELVKGKAGMFFMHTVFAQQLNDAKKDNPDFDFGIMKGIKFTDNPKVLTAASYGGVWVVPSSSKVKEQAKDFLFYILGPEVSKTSAAEGGRVTAQLSANSYLASEKMKVVTQYQLPGLTPDSFYLIDMLPSSVLNSIWHGMQEMVAGKANAETVLKNAQDEMDKVLADKK